MRKVILVAVAAVVVFACSEPVGQVLVDAGDMLADAGDMLADAGDMMQPDAGAQDVSASCNKSDTPEGGYTYYWAEFSIDTPGETEVTVCWHGDPEGVAHWKRDNCHRSIASWFDGTSTGFVYCGQTTGTGDTNTVKSITVHN